MIRILHYGMGPHLGGIETYLLNLVRTLDSPRFQFDFLYSDQGTPPVFAGELPGSRFFGVTPRRTSLRRNRAELEAIFRDEHVDILHFHANTASYVAPVRAALRHGTRVIVHSHNAGARSRLTRTLHRVNRLTLPWDRIARLAVSAEAGRWMFGSRDFEVIHNGIDVDGFAFDPAAREQKRAELGIPPEALVIGNVGAFLPAKNHGFILRVFEEVLRRRPEALLLLVGDGDLHAETEARAHGLGLGEWVRFLGRRDDVPSLLSAMDCLLFPSRYEGFGLAVLEAEAAGLPCVVSEAVPVEVAVSASCRRLSLADSPAVWADAVLRVARAEGGTEGADAVRAAGFTTAANAAAVVRVYERLSRGTA